MTPVELSRLVKRLTAAANAYHNGLEPLMTDAEYDAAVDRLRAASPTHPFLSQVGAPVLVGDEVDLPLPLPSLSKATDATLSTWLERNPATTYVVTPKLDGVSALWFPATGKLYTRGDGLRGRDITAFVPHLTGLRRSTSGGPIAVRGELIMRKDSPAIPVGKIARNIVAGVLNRKLTDFDAALFREVRFVAYELVTPADVAPEEGLARLRQTGLEVVVSHPIVRAATTSLSLSTLFCDEFESAYYPYSVDGVVVAPNVARPRDWVPTVRNGSAVNPTDRVAWKTRLPGREQSEVTEVVAVEWNVSAGGLLIPRVVFKPVVLVGATVRAATGLHGRWIYDNGVGPGARVRVRRAGDVIPQIETVEVPATSGKAAMPEVEWEWIGQGPAEDAVHIRPTGASVAGECAKLVKALDELGAENVGPGVVARLYAAGFTTIRAIYDASVADIAAADGFQQRGAERVWAGLRVKQASWTEINLLVASCTMPRGVGHRKLAPLLALEPNPAKWSTDMTVEGVGPDTLAAIVAAVPAYRAWRAQTGFSVVSPPSVAPSPLGPLGPLAPKATVVFTGTRDKALEAELIARGHTVADGMTKSTTHLVYPDGPRPTTTKVTKAAASGIPVLTQTELRKLLGIP